MSKSVMKTMLITFFVIKGTVHFEFIPQGQSTKLMWKYWSSCMMLYVKKDMNFILIGFFTMTMLQLTMHSVKQFLAQRSVTEMEHSPCSLIWLQRTSECFQK